MRVNICSPLRSYTGGKAAIEARADEVWGLLDELEACYPGIRFRIVDEQDRLRPDLRIFVNSECCNTLQEKLNPTDEVHIIAVLSGG